MQYHLKAMRDPSAILKEFDSEQDRYRAYVGRVASLLNELIADAGIPVHSVVSRLKSRASIERKVNRPSASYGALSDITDIAGVRVICYFADDVDRVAELIEHEFDVDGVNTTDKRKVIDPDRFGYISLHHVVSLPTSRATLTENKRFPGLKAEIQTRSILQHAWAEIEHDLGYKSAGEIPRHVRRRFSRIAGLLELADQEFTEIRHTLETYTRELPRTLDEEPENVLLDLASLTAFVASDENVKLGDRGVAELRGSRLIEYPEDLPNTLHRLQEAGVETIAELKQLLDGRREMVINMASEIFKMSSPARTGGFFAQGIVLWHAAYVFAVERMSDDELEQFVKATGISFTVEQLRAAYRAAAAA